MKRPQWDGVQHHLGSNLVIYQGPEKGGVTGSFYGEVCTLWFAGWFTGSLHWFTVWQTFIISFLQDQYFRLIYFTKKGAYFSSKTKSATKHYFKIQNG